MLPGACALHHDHDHYLPRYTSTYSTYSTRRVRRGRHCCFHPQMGCKPQRQPQPADSQQQRDCIVDKGHSPKSTAMHHIALYIIIYIQYLHSCLFVKYRYLCAPCAASLRVRARCCLQPVEIELATRIGIFAKHARCNPRWSNADRLQHCVCTPSRTPHTAQSSAPQPCQ